MIEGKAVVGKSLPWVFGQSRSALAECRAAEHRSDDLTGALGNCLDRLHTLIDHRPELTREPHVRALRFVRGRYHHQSASIVYREQGGPWRWRSSTQFERPKNKRHWSEQDAADYDGLLAGEPVEDALKAVEVAVNALT